MTHASHKVYVRSAIVILVSLGILISSIAVWDDLKEGWSDGYAVEGIGKLNN